VEKLNRWGSSNILPDLTFLIDVPVAVGLARKKGKLLDRLEKEGKKFELKVFNGYHGLAKRHRRIHIIDGTPPQNEVAKSVQKIVNKLLQKVEKQ
jgi:dTMP kinase